jgi:PAS domain-containing protein
VWCRHRERNKFLARKTRLRKREELDTLRDQVAALQAENDKLKVMVRSSIPEPNMHMEANDLDPALPEQALKAVRALLAQSEEYSPSSATPKGICISNATAPDHPIVYASVGFLELTGYDMHSILGHNCRILQGPDTDRNEVRIQTPIRYYQYKYAHGNVIQISTGLIGEEDKAGNRRKSRGNRGH